MKNRIARKYLNKNRRATFLFIRNLMRAGLWEKMDHIYPIITPNMYQTDSEGLGSRSMINLKSFEKVDAYLEGVGPYFTFKNRTYHFDGTRARKLVRQ